MKSRSEHLKKSMHDTHYLKEDNYGQHSRYGNSSDIVNFNSDGDNCKSYPKQKGRQKLLRMQLRLLP